MLLYIKNIHIIFRVVFLFKNVINKTELVGRLLRSIGNAVYIYVMLMQVDEYVGAKTSLKNC